MFDLSVYILILILFGVQGASLSAKENQRQPISADHKIDLKKENQKSQIADFESFKFQNGLLENMLKNFQKSFESFDQQIDDLHQGGGTFGQSSLFGQSANSEEDILVIPREDKSFLYYDVVVENMENSGLDIKIENGQIIISANIKKTIADESNNSYSSYQSSFQRVLPLPAGVLEKDVKMSSEKNKLIIKIPKKNKK